MQVLGIDIGGSGIKGSPVDTNTGEMLGERFRIPTPQPATKDAVLKTIGKIAKNFDWKGPVGCGFPGVIHKGVIATAANLDDSLKGVNLAEEVGKTVGRPAVVVNDADAAGLAIMRFGIGRDEEGLVMVITIGTGIGTAIFYNGALIPNSELGHAYLKLKKESKIQDAETLVSDSARKRDDISWKHWGGRFNEYLKLMERLVNPQLFILGGGAASKGDKFLKYLKVDTPVKTAALENRAGIIGAAMASREFGQ
ncbi:ROK family protein [Ruficoccus amylovorans]|uniref:ROK family protein n=1 Tax=Ruficoccus amylovorans TaxID=1804625 RepID=A0A842HBJ1_9BACT|nr:ROK family protein [Ruficoccus amylovorans]MBC2593640.1 ROK family protein [Ruficoccus amylovorans]